MPLCYLEFQCGAAGSAGSVSLLLGELKTGRTGFKSHKELREF